MQRVLIDGRPQIEGATKSPGIILSLPKKRISRYGNKLALEVFFPLSPDRRVARNCVFHQKRPLH
jgi:hypothetical protein